MVIGTESEDLSFMAVVTLVRDGCYWRPKGFESPWSCWTQRLAYLEQQQKAHNDTVVKMRLIFSCFVARLLYSEQDSRLLLMHVYYMCNLLVEYMHEDRA